MLTLTQSGRIADVVSQARAVPERVIPYATAAALTQTAKAGQQAVKRLIPAVFDRPTPYIQNSTKVRVATKTDLRAEVAIKEAPGSRAENTLLPQVFGGSRRHKAFESALRYAGVMPAGHFAVAANVAATTNAYGNIPGPLMNQILAYFGGFSEQGYLANMNDKRRRRLARVRKNERGYRTITGKRYFVIRDDMPNYSRQGLRQPGIYSATGVHGVNVMPVVLFVPRVQYRAVLPFHRVVDEAVRTTFQPAFERAVAGILARNPSR